MRNFIYAIGVCSLLFSCNSELETLPEEFNTEGTAPLVTRVAAHPKYGVLGWGYDVTGNYMSHGKGVTLPVIDIDRFEAENFDRIVLDSSTSQETEYYYGTTAEEYLKRVGDNVDTGVDAKKALFSLTITGNYQKNTSYSVGIFFCRMRPLLFFEKMLYKGGGRAVTKLSERYVPGRSRRTACRRYRRFLRHSCAGRYSYGRTREFLV